MRRPFALIAMLAAVPIASVARAAEAQLFDLWPNERSVELMIYYSAECGPECRTFRIKCSADGWLDIGVYGLTRDDLRTWTEVTGRPFAAGQATMFYLVRAGDNVESFATRSLVLEEINLLWIAEATVHGLTDEPWFTAFGTAREIVVELPSREIALPDAPEVREARAAFAEACLAL